MQTTIERLEDAVHELLPQLDNKEITQQEAGGIIDTLGVVITRAKKIFYELTVDETKEKPQLTEEATKEVEKIERNIKNAEYKLGKINGTYMMSDDQYHREYNPDGFIDVQEYETTMAAYEARINAKNTEIAELDQKLSNMSRKSSMHKQAGRDLETATTAKTHLEFKQLELMRTSTVVDMKRLRKRQAEQLEFITDGHKRLKQMEIESIRAKAEDDKETEARCKAGGGVHFFGDSD